MSREPETKLTTSTTRTEAYTDGVFAIAATLLVLDLTAQAVGDVTTDAQMWAALGRMWPSFLSFAISFVLLSLLWIVHLQVFRDIAAVDNVLLWLNNARLLFVVLIPFTTSLGADYSTFTAGRVLLPVNFFLASLFGHLSWRWAAAKGGQLIRPEQRPHLEVHGADGLAALICGAVAAVLSPWLGSAGFLAYAFNGVLRRLLLRRRVQPNG